MAHFRIHNFQHESVKAVLFDKDGTLSYSEPMLKKLADARISQCLHLAKINNRESSPPHQLVKLLMKAYGASSAGISPAGATAVASRSQNLIATATVFTQVGFDWPDALELSEQAFALTDHLQGQDGDHPPQPTVGLVDFLERLQECNVCCAVISNDHEVGIRSFLSKHALDHYFQGLWSADHWPAKPLPGAVLGLCEMIGVLPRDCILVGDSNSDLRMARSAGVSMALGYRAGWQQPIRLDSCFPQLSHWDELTVQA